MATDDQPPLPGLPFLLAKAHKAAQTGLDRVLKKESLSVEQWRILQALRDGDGCTMSELSGRSLLTMSALSKNADRLVSRALIMRQRDAGDHRRVLVRLTDFGLELIARCDDGVAAFEKDMASPLSPDDQKHLARLLDAVTRKDRVWQ